MSEDKEFTTWWNTNPNVVAWRQAIRQKYGEDPSPDASEYDYRAAFKAGVVPVGVPYDDVPHWSSQFKSDTHPNRFVQTPEGLLDTKYDKIIDTPQGLFKPPQQKQRPENGGQPKSLYR